MTRFPVRPSHPRYPAGGTAECCRSDRLPWPPMPSASTSVRPPIASACAAGTAIGSLGRTAHLSAGRAVDVAACVDATPEFNANPDTAHVARAPALSAGVLAPPLRPWLSEAFDGNTLVALRMEDEQVFTDTHALIMRWPGGRPQGVRLDHPDGLGTHRPMAAVAQAARRPARGRENSNG
jgi:hypothetical protein